MQLKKKKVLGDISGNKVFVMLRRKIETCALFFQEPLGTGAKRSRSVALGDEPLKILKNIHCPKKFTDTHTRFPASLQDAPREKVQES